MDGGCHKYDDIINLPHHVSERHPKMSMSTRAAQFAPFAALPGYEDAVTQTARLTDSAISLDETQKAVIDACIQLISEHMAERPEVEITFFQPDAHKDGGSYVSAKGNLKRIDTVERCLVLTDGRMIKVDKIIQIESPLLHPIHIHLE